eukprot:TRINITY_DN12833_c0_g1_i2.p1 TRINITY_DN12833_c0_g1~~TRINITY_DN12833_c0_g1_i2.p1  ORF type:complete len:379 (-),score=114.24 TRINITY_DN12833_c0_g1_i2:59-1144(-)
MCIRDSNSFIVYFQLNPLKYSLKRVAQLLPQHNTSMAHEAYFFCAAGFCCICLIISTILFAISYAIVDVNEVGILRNTVSKKVENGTIYYPGRYWVGLSGSFIIYPTTWQQIDFSSDADSDSSPISAKTSNPSGMTLSIILMFRYKVEFLPALFNKYPAGNQKKDMVSSSKDQIQKVVSQYSNDDFFQKRVEISGEMSRRVHAVLRETFFAEVVFFQINEIILESKFENQLITQQVQKRDGITSQKQQEMQILQGEINVINSQADNDVANIIAQANRERALISANWTSAGDAAILKAQTEGYKLFADPAGLNFQAADIMKFVYYDNLLNDASNTDVLAGFDQPTFKISTQRTPQELSLIHI